MAVFYGEKKIEGKHLELLKNAIELKNKVEMIMQHSSLFKGGLWNPFLNFLKEAKEIRLNLSDNYDNLDNDYKRINKISWKELSFLKRLDNIVRFELRDTIDDLSFLGWQKHLKQVLLEPPLVLDLTKLPLIESLEELYLGGKYKNLEHLVHYKNLYFLHLSAVGKKRNLSFLEKMDGLTSMEIVGSFNEDFFNKIALPEKMRAISFYRYAITKFDFLYRNPHIETILIGSEKVNLDIDKLFSETGLQTIVLGQDTYEKNKV